MASYRIEWRRSARKDLRGIAAHDVVRIFEVVERLATDPFGQGSIKLSGSDRTYRVRVGDFRILYEVHSGHLIVEVIKIAHRRDVYRG